MSWPHAWNYYLSPLGTRPAWERRTVADYGNVPGSVSGQLPGTPAYVEAGQGGTTVAVTVPAEYLWDGTGTVPKALADLAAVLVWMLGGGALPDRSNGPAWGDALRALYAGLQECGVAYSVITGAIGAAAPDPWAIARIIEADMRTRPICARAIKNPIPAAAVTVAPSTDTGPTVTMVKANGAIVTAPAAAPVPWGWIAGGVGVLALVGVAVYFGTRKRKGGKRRNPRRENPCGTCSNPSDGWIETSGYEVLEAPARSGTRKNPRRGRGKRSKARRGSSGSPSGKRKRRRANMAASTRERLAARDFAIPERRTYPIQSEAQAVRALSFAEWPQNRPDRRRVRHAVFERYPELHHSPPYRSNEYGGSLQFPGPQSDVLALQGPFMLPIVGNPGIGEVAGWEQSAQAWVRSPPNVRRSAAGQLRWRAREMPSGGSERQRVLRLAHLVEAGDVGGVEAINWPGGGRPNPKGGTRRQAGRRGR